MQSKQSILQKSDGGKLDWFANFVPKWILLKRLFESRHKIYLHLKNTIPLTETLSKLNSLYWNPPAHGNKVSIEDQVEWSTGNCSNDKDEWKLEIWQHFLRSWIPARKDKDRRPAGTRPNGMQHMENLSWQFVLYFQTSTHKTQR